VSEGVSLQDFAEHLNYSLRDNDPKLPELQRTLAAAIDVVERRCGPMRTATSTLRLRPSGRYLVLSATHVTEVVQVRDPQGRVVQHDTARSNLAAGIIDVGLHHGPAAGGLWEVDISIDGSDVPDDLVLATLIIGSHLWETQRARSSRPQAYQGEPGDVAPRGFAVPSRAAELMAGYQLPGFA
jgi:hypothetical protein